MAASKRARACVHTAQVMVAYMPGAAGKRGEHMAIHWCPDCGSLCHRKYDGKWQTDTWAAPTRK